MSTAPPAIAGGSPGPDAPPVRYGWRRERLLYSKTSAQQKKLLGVPRPRRQLLGVPRPRRQPPVTNAMLLLGSHHCRGRCSRGTIRASERVLPVALVLNTDGGWCLLGSHHCRGTRAGMFGCSRQKNSRNFLQPKKFGASKNVSFKPPMGLSQTTKGLSQTSKGLACWVG